jgi:hypothetical protein
MVAGRMMDPERQVVGGGMMSANTSNTRHVEVAICDRRSSTVTGADVAMMVATNGATPGCLCRDARTDEPAADHYGTTCRRLVPTVAFTVNGQTGTFTIVQ